MQLIYGSLSTIIIYTVFFDTSQVVSRISEKTIKSTVDEHLVITS